jgi:hypothetical protein
MLDMSANREDTLPSSDRIRTDDWMDSFKLASNIFWSTTSLFVKLEAPSLCSFDKAGLGKRCCECLQKFLIWFTDAIVDLVPRSPKSTDVVSTSRTQVEVCTYSPPVLGN